MREESPVDACTPRAWVMTLLVAVYAANFIDRTIINVLQQPIKLELSLQDWQLGMLGGTTFALFYTVIGLYVARLAERRDRTHVLTGCILVWSGFTAACGLATSFVQILLLRIGVAVGEAGCTPTSHSLIADYHTPDKRPGALAIFATGNTIGLVLGALLGGIIAHAWGWRWAFALAGAPGLVLAALTLFTLREPRRIAIAATSDVPPMREVAATLFAKPTWRHLTIAASLSVFTAYGIAAFVTPHLMRSFALDVRTAGILGGVGGGAALGVGTLIGGFTAQRLATRDRRWMAWTPGIAMLLAAPLSMLAFAANRLDVAIPAYVLAHVGMGTLQGPLFSTNHSFVGPRMRATASAILLLIMTLIGLGLGPLAVGSVSDVLAAASFAGNDYARVCRAGTASDPACLAASAAGLRWALALVSAVLTWAALHYFLAARTIRADVID